MKRGFTLVEILTVMGIIAVLAAILFPVVATARRRALHATCLSNLSQIGKAISLYATDHDDRMPYAPSPSHKKIVVEGGQIFDPPALDAVAASLPDVRTPLAPYGATQTVFVCPMDQVSRLLLDEGGHKPTWVEECGASYNYDDKYAFAGGLFAGSPRPSEHPIAWDIEGFHSDANAPSYNAVFADLHVKALTSPQFAADSYGAAIGTK